MFGACCFRLCELQCCNSCFGLVFAGCGLLLFLLVWVILCALGWVFWCCAVRGVLCVVGGGVW